MKFVYRKNGELPKLAWCLEFDPATGIARVDHGPWVETSEEGFVEGAWPGPFERLGFDEAYFLAGSGARLREGRIVVSAPTDTTEALFSLKGRNGRVYLSNSIPFLLQMSGEELDLQYLDYESDNLSACEGLEAYVRESPTASGNRFRIYYWCNIRIAPDGSLEEVPKPPPGPIGTYAEYLSLLRGQIKSLCDNAASPARVRTYRPLAFASNGYDSPACAALARELGCDDAVVFETKKTFLRSDSGAEIVRLLGYTNVVELHELDYRKEDVADYFVATGELGTSIFFASAARQLEGRILFSGVNGDTTWSTVPEPHGRAAPARGCFYPDSSRREFRLATGYVNMIIPFIAMMRQPDLLRISNSEEMRPWRIGGSYDRPIPRRILEEKGVPRSLFGFTKGGGCGSSLRFGTLSRLRATMPPASFERFAEYYRGVSRRRNRFSPRYLWRVGAYLFFVANTLATRNRPGAWKTALERWTPRAYTCSPFAPSFLFPWGVESLQKKHYSKVERSGAPAGGR